jgi:hypothetical protein
MMNRPNETCRDEQRKVYVRQRGPNGIDYVEISDDQRTLSVYFLRKAPENITRENVRIDGGVRVQRIRVIDLRLCVLDDPEQDDCMRVTVASPGDFSTYTLRLVEVDQHGQPTDVPLSGFDPRYAQLDFSFKAGCPSDVDCQASAVCPTLPAARPEINYLAKDYASFRQMIFDRLATTMPSWQEQHVPDLGVALVEVLAYVGDYLSYYQDAVATEAYLNTARKRISVRRHARLVDYAMHEGCNARAWLTMGTDQAVINPPIDPANVRFISGYEGPASGTILTSGDLLSRTGTYEVFEPITTEPIRIYPGHSPISFYTWGNERCCLPAGATKATLLDEAPQAAQGGAAAPLPPQPKPEDKQAGQRASSQHREKKSAEPPAPASPPPDRVLHLQAGDILIFEEVLGPNTGVAADADPTHRHPVRLTRVKQSVDKLYGKQILEIEWSAADALPFGLCLSSMGMAPKCALIQDVSVAHGNVILVDHGMQVRDERLGVVPAGETNEACEDLHRPVDTVIQPGDFELTLKHSPLTFRQNVRLSSPAAGLLVQEPRGALPCIRLTSIPPLPDGTGPLFSFDDLTDQAALAIRLAKPPDEGSRFLRGHFSAKVLHELDQHNPSTPLPQSLAVALLAELNQLLRHWTPQPDLLSSGARDFHYVVEIDDDGLAHLRFGDGELGRAPQAGECFSATYRVESGTAGNVGSETINRMALREGVLSGANLQPRNPLAARGGVDPEPITEVQSFAPGAFRKQLERAITADDYAHLAERNPKVQRAAAVLLWTGSRFEAHVALDPLGTEQADAHLLAEIQGYLHRYRRVGHDVVVVPATYVSLYVKMSICVLPNYLRGHVEAALLDVFSNRVLPGGGRGFFHPDNLTFGDNIYLSRLVAAAQVITGVESVTVQNLERQFVGPNGEIESGVLPVGPLEVARLDNDPIFPENGLLVLDLRGGR